MIAIPIVLVMYFALLHARFEGERFAPGKIEKWVVILLISLPSLAFFFWIVAYGNPRESSIYWMTYVGGIVATYLILIPVRMMLRVRIHPIEAWLIIALVLTVGTAMVALPIFMQP